MSEPTSDERRSASTSKQAAGKASLPEIPGYRLLRTLGRGAMGSVYLAVEESLRRRVAVKLLTRDFAQKDGAQEQFEREARTMATVEHPHVVRVYAFGDAGRVGDHQPYLAMELVEGETLEERIEREGGLGLAEALRIAKETCEALRAAWRRRIVHRDVKPGNILLDEEGRVRVGDFGIAKPLELEDGALTSTGCSLGTPRYLSPEQASGEAIDFRTDVYSLGVVLWEMMVGHAPFRDANAVLLLKRHLLEKLPTLASAGVEVPAAVEQLVARMTAKSREERFGSYDDLLAAIAAIVSDCGEGGAAVPPATDAGSVSDRAGSGQWFYVRGRDRVGPIEYSELVRRLQAREIDGSTRVWGPGFESWKPADLVDGLTSGPASARDVLSLLSAGGASRSIFDEMQHAARAAPGEAVDAGIGGARVPVAGTAGDAGRARTELVAPAGSGEPEPTTSGPDVESDVPVEPPAAAAAGAVSPAGPDREADPVLADPLPEAPPSPGPGTVRSEPLAGPDPEADPVLADPLPGAPPAPRPGTGLGEAPAAPPMPAPSEAAEGPSPSSPPTGSSPSGPPTGSSPSGPPTGSSPSGPPTGSSPSGPPTGSSPSGPPTGSSPSGPPTGSSSSGPPTGSSPSGPPKGSSRLVFWDPPLSGDSSPPESSTASRAAGLDNALDAVEVKLNVKREDLRRQEMLRSSVRVRFERLKQEVLKPAFRDVMVRFHAKGYPTRLKEVGSNEIRLEFTVDSAAHCSFEVELTGRGSIVFRYVKNMRDVAEEEVPIDEVDPAGIERRIADLLVKALAGGR